MGRPALFAVRNSIVSSTMERAAYLRLNRAVNMPCIYTRLLTGFAVQKEFLTMNSLSSFSCRVYGQTRARDAVRVDVVKCDGKLDVETQRRLYTSVCPSVCLSVRRLSVASI